MQQRDRQSAGWFLLKSLLVVLAIDDGVPHGLVEAAAMLAHIVLRDATAALRSHDCKDRPKALLDGDVVIQGLDHRYDVVGNRLLFRFGTGAAAAGRINRSFLRRRR